MYRPVSNENSVRTVFFGQKNKKTLETVLQEDAEERIGPLNETQKDRLEKMLVFYVNQVYDKQGERPLSVLNKEVLGACSKDFIQYIQRKEAVKNKNPVNQVMDDSLYQDTSKRMEQLSYERKEVKTLPPPIPDFRISLTEDGPAAAELFAKAKRQREIEWTQSSDLVKADTGLQQRIQADSQFRTFQDQQNRKNEIIYPTNKETDKDKSLAILPDRRELLMGPIGSFDTYPEKSGQANGNPTLVTPFITKPDLPQDTIIKEESVVSYREIENNLFIYSADRDWLKNNKENRYQFTVQFDPAANGQKFSATISAQQKFKNIVRIELVKAILPGESTGVTIQRNRAVIGTDTTLQDDVLNLPYVIVRVAELENNNYGTDNFVDRSFGVIQYDAQWISDNAQEGTRGFFAMIPKFLKCQKEYYPTPLSTLQKMSIDLRRPNGELISTSPDTFDIGGILAPQVDEIVGTTFPFTNVIKFGESMLAHNIMIPEVNGNPAYFYINTTKYFSRFDMCVGDRLQIAGYNYPDVALNDPNYGQNLRGFCQWINRPEGHVVLGTAYALHMGTPNETTNIRDGLNEVGYANFIVIQARYQDPSNGSVLLQSFGPNFGATLNSFGIGLQSPVRLMNMNRQLQLVFRIITREMDSLPQLRPDNNY
jgi:hypothetical protein